MARYGAPYTGSKNTIAEQIVNILPASGVLYDLFAGGCAVTHCAMLSGKWERVVANDIQGNGVELFHNALSGKYQHETRWISREDFFRLRDTDVYVKYSWSFGNTGRTYLYGSDLEAYKKAYHYAVCFGDVSLMKQLNGIDLSPLLVEEAFTMEGIHKRRTFARKLITEHLMQKYDVVMKNNYKYLPRWAHKEVLGLQTKKDVSYRSLERLQNLESIEQLQYLQSMRRTERLQNIKKCQDILETLKLDYREVIPFNHDGDFTVYCDPPYKGTETKHYNTNFNQDEFYDWLRSRKYPVYVSEYTMPEDFVTVLSIPKRNTFSGTENKATTENVYVHRRFSDRVLAYEGKKHNAEMQISLQLN